MESVKKKIFISIICIFIITAIILICTNIFKNDFNKYFVGDYEAYQLVFTFDDFPREEFTILGKVIEPNKVTSQTAPKNRYFINNNNFSMLFSSPATPPYIFTSGVYSNYLILNEIKYEIIDVKKLSEEEIEKNKFLSRFNIQVKPIKYLKNGFILKTFETGSDKYIQYIYYLDNEYYTNDELYAYKLDKVS